MHAGTKDHPIAIEPSPKRVRVSFNGRTIADSQNALSLKEARYPAVLYIPRGDADMSVFERTDHHTRCPFKGDASYFTLKVNGRTAQNAVWSYETPFPAVSEIKDHLAFYSDRVDSIEVTGGASDS